MLYPYRIRVTDPVLIKTLKTVANHRMIKTEPNITKSIGHMLPRTLKKDGIYIKDSRIGIENPKITLDFEPAYGKKKGYDFIFKSIF